MLTIDIKEGANGVSTVLLKGRLDTSTYQLFEERVKELAENAPALVIDMGGIDYVSSMGMSALFRIQVALEAHKGTMAMVNMQPHIQEVFRTMKVLTPQIFATLTEADEYLDRFLDNIQTGKIRPEQE